MSSRQPVYYQDKYLKGGLTDKEAETILTLINNYKVVENLKHSITDAPSHVIEDIKFEAQAYEKKHGSLKGYVPSEFPVGVGTLRDEQTMGAAFMFYAGSCLLGDEVGLGKTVQIAALANILSKQYKKENRRPFRFLFLTEKSSTGQIQDKLIQFTGEYVGLIDSGVKSKVDKYLSNMKDGRFYSVVGSHSLLGSSEFLIHTAQNPFDLIVIDESNIAKNTTSASYKACKQILQFHKRRIFLNATPLEINLREVYNQLDLIDPLMMPTVKVLEARYINYGRGYFTRKEQKGYKNEEHFKESISLRYYARTRGDLGAVYEDNSTRMFLIPMSDTQKELMKKTSLYTMVTDYPTGVNRDVHFNEDTTPKLKALNYIIDELVGVFSEQVLVYCNFVDAQNAIKDILEEKGYRVAILNGRGSTKKVSVRTEIARDFNNGDYDVLLTNVLRGLDLNACDNCIMYTIDKNPQKMVQFEGRITREFDIIGKNVFMLVSMGREKKHVENVLKMRVDASESFTVTGKSMVLAAIKSAKDREIFGDVTENSYSPEEEENED